MRPWIYKVNGKVVSEKEFRKNSKGLKQGAPMTQQPSCWPQYSRAMSVSKHRKEEAEAHAEKIGVPTTYKIIGRRARPEFRSKKHRREFCTAMSMYDMDGGYNDPKRRGD